MKTEEKTRPSFPLMTLSHIVSFYHLQMPRWLFFDPKYADMELESKVAYTFLLNRFQLSRRNGWINEHGEVFIIYTREDLAKEMQISYRKAIACFKALCDKQLLWETRMGRGIPNHIYLAEVMLDPSASYSYDCAPFSEERPAETACLEENETAEHEHVEMGPKPSDSKENDVQGASKDRKNDAQGLSSTGGRSAETALLDAQDLPEAQLQTCQNSISIAAETACPDLPKPHASKKDNNKKDLNEKEDQSVSPSDTSMMPLTDAQKLTLIEQGCELEHYSEDESRLLREAVAWLFYCKELYIGRCCYPQDYVRSRLVLLNPDILDFALDRLRRNENTGVQNTLAYAAKVLFTSLAESSGEIVLDPIINKWKRGHMS